MLSGVDAFYEDVVQHLKAWSAAPPKLRTDVPPPPDEKPSLASTALSSQDGAEPATDSPEGRTAANALMPFHGTVRARPLGGTALSRQVQQQLGESDGSQVRDL